MSKKTFKGDTFLIKGVIKSNSLLQFQEIIGSFYGQTKDFLDKKLDLENLFHNGKIGRIQIKIIGNNKYEFIIPTSLSVVDCSLVAASLESIKIIGGSPCEVKIIEISNKNNEIRKNIYKRAQELLLKINQQILPIKDDIIKSPIIEIIPNKIYGSKNVLSKTKIFLVEGRADIRKLHSIGVNNVLSINGYNNPKELFKLIKDKQCILFVDNDSVGEKIKEKFLKRKEVIGYVKTPKNKTVEDLSEKELKKSIKNIVFVNKSLNNKDQDKKNNEKVNINNKKEKGINEKNRKYENGKNKRYNDLVNDLQNNLINNNRFDKNYFTKKEFEIINNKISQIKDSGKFFVLSKNFRKIQEDKVSKILKTNLKKGRVLILDGIYESSLNNKLKDYNFEFIISKRKSNLKNLKQPVLTFNKIKDMIEF